MSAVPAMPEPSRAELLREVETLRQRVEALEQEKHDLEVMLEMATEHADDLSEELEQERNDLEVMLEMTTEHADVVEDEFQSRADDLEAQSQFVRDTFAATFRKTWSRSCSMTPRA